MSILEARIVGSSLTLSITNLGPHKTSVEELNVELNYVCIHVSILLSVHFFPKAHCLTQLWLRRVKRWKLTPSITIHLPFFCSHDLNFISFLQQLHLFLHPLNSFWTLVKLNIILILKDELIKAQRCYVTCSNSYS